MKRIAIVWMVAQLGGCVPNSVGLGLGLALLRPNISWRDGAPPSDPCIHTIGATRDRCFAANPSLSDEAAEGWAVELKTRRENAAIRATGERLESEAPARPPTSEPAIDASLPDRLDPTMIANVLATVKPALMACRSGATGQVLVHVNVVADGRVAGVTVEHASDPALGSCTVAAVKRARFVKTQRGGSFRYPFVF